MTDTNNTDGDDTDKNTTKAGNFEVEVDTGFPSETHDDGDLHPDVARHESTVKVTRHRPYDYDRASVAAELRALADTIESGEAHIRLFDHDRLKPHQLTDDNEWARSSRLYRTVFLSLAEPNDTTEHARASDD